MISIDQAAALLEQAPPTVPPGQITVEDATDPHFEAHARGVLFDLGEVETR